MRALNEIDTQFYKKKKQKYKNKNCRQQQEEIKGRENKNWQTKVPTMMEK